MRSPLNPFYGIFLIFQLIMGLDAYKTTMQYAKENTKQIFDINTKAAKNI